MRELKWFAVNGLFAVGIYYGFQEEIQGAKNIVLFYAWLNIVLTMFILHEDIIKQIAKKGRSVPKEFNALYDIAITSVFAWYGSWILATFWFIHFIIQEIAWDRSTKTTKESV